MTEPGQPRHFLTTQDWTREEIDALVARARALVREPLQPLLAGRSIALLFLDPSLRTRTSFELGIQELGGFAVVLEPGKGAWPIEFEDGVVMDGDAEVHVSEVARVLSEYCDLIAVRAFPRFQSWEEDRTDRIIRSVAKYATVPVINMETVVHPCQELALAMTLRERLGDTDGRRFLLTWTYHPRPLNTAVANSALLIATKLGMEVTLLCPNPEFLLDRRYLDAARDNAALCGGSLRVTYDIESAYDSVDFVYAKSWGALPYYGRWQDERPIRDRYEHFIVDEEKMARTRDGLFSHCLPVRRNVKVTDGVLDSPRSVAIEEAGNRLHTQKALMDVLVNGP